MTNKKAQAISQVAILLVGLFAFAFIIGGMGEVSAIDFSKLAPKGLEKVVPPVPAKVDVSSLTPKGLEVGTQKINVPSEMSPVPAMAVPTTPSFWDGGFLGTEGLFGSELLESAANGIITAGISFGFYWGAKQIANNNGASPLETNFWAGMAGLVGSVAAVWAVFGSAALTNSWNLAGWAIGLIIILYFASTDVPNEIGVVQYSCLPWEPISGGDNCELCNEQEIPCSEYQCRSLGKDCKFDIDPDNDLDSICYESGINDNTPPTISLNENELKVGLIYTPNNAFSPPDIGFKIVNPEKSDGCVYPFDLIRFGILTDEPAKCRWSTERTARYKDMTGKFFESARPSYEHSQFLVIEDLLPRAFSGQENDLSIYLRCQDSRENENRANFVLSLCAEKGMDLRAPKIIGTDPIDRAIVAFNISEMDIDIFVNKPAECKWSIQDKSYNEMENNFNCEGERTYEAQAAYLCSTTLNGLISDQEDKFYFRCEDKTENKNQNSRSFPYTLIGSRALEIISAGPNQEIINVASNFARVELTAETFGGSQEGIATCVYSLAGEGENFPFTDSESNLHSHEISLPEGDYSFDIKCFDNGNNADIETINFTVETDYAEPLIARAYYDEGYMKIITNELAECVYSSDSCTYEFEDGISASYIPSLEHLIEWDTESNLYVKCQDTYGNRPASSTQCSIELRAHEY